MTQYSINNIDVPKAKKKKKNYTSSYISQVSIIGSTLEVRFLAFNPVKGNSTDPCSLSQFCPNCYASSLIS